MNKTNYKCVLFDLDGTLIDTAPDFYRVMKLLCENHSQAVMTMTAVRETVSHGARALVMRAFEITERDEKFSLLRQELLDIYFDNLAVDTRLFPELDKLLHNLQLQDIPWGIVTNKPRLYAEKVLEELQLDQHCAALVCPDDVSKTKPHPEPLYLAAQQIAVAPEHCIYIGDHQRDIAAGLAANMLTIAAAYGYIDEDDDPNKWRAHHLVDSPETLNKLVLQLL